MNGHSVTNKKAVIEGDGNEGIAKQGEDCFVAASEACITANCVLGQRLGITLSPKG